ncbi:MAG: leucine-rich repeat domain-containing protein, partial [bacterium]|nr:leucine-rich repeat domain-containing protein [bacterium]
MTNDLEIIKRLEKNIGKKFKKAVINAIRYYHKSGYYAVNEENRVIGLNLSQTNLTKGPEELKALPGLVSLNLYDNQICDISFLKDLANLTKLYLHNNQIRQLPRWVLDWDMGISWGKNSGIVLKGNPLETPPVEIVKEGKKAVIEYFKALDGDKKALNEVKVLLVGDGGAGKTS